MWASPDAEEQQKVTAVVSALCLAIPGTDELLLPIVRNRLSAASVGLVAQYFVGPACEFLHRYHSEALHYPTDPDWFTGVSRALFGSEYLPLFYGTLSELCGHYYDLFDQLPVTIARFLLTHWPRANPPKTVCFIEHTGALFGRLTDTDASMFAPGLLRCLTEALLSASDASAQAAVGLLGRRGFLGRLRIGGVAARRLETALLGVQTSPGQAIALQVGTVLEQLRNIKRESSEGGVPDEPSGRESGWLAIWEAGSESTGIARESFAESLAGGR
jgi:hypothetical protein